MGVAGSTRSITFGLAFISALLCWLPALKNAGGVTGAGVKADSGCTIKNIIIQSFFAVDAFYEAKDSGGFGKNVPRNRFVFVTDTNAFLFNMESVKENNVDTFNGIFAFGDTITKFRNFSDDTGGKMDIGEAMTKVGNLTVLDALEKIIDVFGDIEDPKTDYVRFGFLITDRPLRRSATAVKNNDGNNEDERVERIMSTIKSEKIVMYGLGREKNRPSLKFIAGSEDRVIANNFTDTSEALDIGKAFESVLCKSIEDNRIKMVVIGAGTIVGIIIAILATVAIIYLLKKHAYDKYQLQKLAEAQENLKNKSEANRLYKEPVTKTNLADLGVVVNEN